MNDRFWLIQRGSFNDPKTATEFLGGSAKHLINPDYMGSAEFEWGAIPKAYRRILGRYEQYELIKTDLKTVRDVPLYIFCRSECYSLIMEQIRKLLDYNNNYPLKEYSSMQYHFTEKYSMYRGVKYMLRTNFWWCIDVARTNTDVGDWFAFLGATDRVNAIQRILDKDYKEFWMAKPEEERNKEFTDSFRAPF